jgi:hypothetical protein
MTTDELKQIKGLIDDSAVETKRHFDVVGESLRTDIRIVAEGHVMLNEKIERLRGEMHSEFDELRSAIRFSYAEIDRRVSTLESELASLSHRVERVEALVAH